MNHEINYSQPLAFLPELDNHVGVSVCENVCDYLCNELDG